MTPRLRNRLVVAAAIVALLAIGVLATSGPPPPTPSTPGTFSFAVLGDAPYFVWEDVRFPLVLRDLDAHDLAFVIHVGDIFWGPCTDGRYRRSLDWFNGLRHPVIYTPGDNEWTDCWERVTGRFAPRERLASLRRIFFAEPTRSLGGRALELASQSTGDAFPELVENARWSHRGVVFATFHLVGSQNGLEWPGHDDEDEAESRRRTAGATEWLRETFVEARGTGASAVVLAFHANPGFEEPTDDPYRRSYEPFLETLEEQVERFGGPVLMVHGDDHEYVADHPLWRRTTGRMLVGLTRMQVPGSPDVGWVRVEVSPGAEAPFAFESRVVPQWKYW